MARNKGGLLWPALVSLFILLAAALVAFPMYVHYEVVGTTGAYAPLYLYEHSPYDTITVEVLYQAGAVPSDVALDNLRQTLAKYTYRDIEIKKIGDIPADAVPEHIDDNNATEIGDSIIQKYGQGQMGWLGGSIPMYIIYLNASGRSTGAGENDAVVGISYRADSFMVLMDGINSVGLEKSVLVHETGHLLGLEHCDNQSCVMSSVLVQKSSWSYGIGGPPTDFCPIHQQELADRRQDLFYNMNHAALNVSDT